MSIGPWVAWSNGRRSRRIVAHKQIFNELTDGDTYWVEWQGLESPKFTFDYEAKGWIKEQVKP